MDNGVSEDSVNKLYRNGFTSQTVFKWIKEEDILGMDLQSRAQVRTVLGLASMPGQQTATTNLRPEPPNHASSMDPLTTS